jgi:hypothetical protein
MNLFKRLSLSLIAFLLCATANAQDMKISGTVYDSTGTQPLHQAMVMAVRVKDSVLLGFTRTEKSGKFVLTGFPQVADPLFAAIRQMGACFILWGFQSWELS